MNPVETAKPCLSKKEKSPKLYLLLAVMRAAWRISRIFGFVNYCYGWLKNFDWTLVWAEAKDFLL